MSSLSSLRDLLHSAPSSQAWAALCAMLDTWPRTDTFDIALAYTLETLEHWPDALRTPYAPWRQHLIAHGTHHPCWPLVRAYHVALGAMYARLNCMRQIRDVSLSYGLRLNLQHIKAVVEGVPGCVGFALGHRHARDLFRALHTSGEEPFLLDAHAQDPAPNSHTSFLYITLEELSEEGRAPLQKHLYTRPDLWPFVGQEFNDALFTTLPHTLLTGFARAHQSNTALHKVRTLQTRGLVRISERLEPSQYSPRLGWDLLVLGAYQSRQEEAAQALVMSSVCAVNTLRGAQVALDATSPVLMATWLDELSAQDTSQALQHAGVLVGLAPSHKRGPNAFSLFRLLPHIPFPKPLSPIQVQTLLQDVLCKTDSIFRTSTAYADTHEAEDDIREMFHRHLGRLSLPNAVAAQDRLTRRGIESTLEAIPWEIPSAYWVPSLGS